MAQGRNYSVAPHARGWEVRRDGASRASSIYASKSEALAAGRELARARRGELRIKGQDGRIQNSSSYGRDPYPPRDTRR